MHFKTSSAEIPFSKSSCTNISVSLSNVWSSSSGMLPSFSKCSTKRSWLMASTVCFFWRLLLFRILQYARGSEERNDLILSWKTFVCIRLFLFRTFLNSLCARALSPLVLIIIMTFMHTFSFSILGPFLLAFCVKPRVFILFYLLSSWLILIFLSRKLAYFKRALGAVWKSRWPSWAVRPNEPHGFRGRKAILKHANALVSGCP